MEGRQEKNPFQSTTNVTVFYTASSSWSYRTFTLATTFEAMEALYFRQEKVLEYPGNRDLMDNIDLVPKEFVAEENLNYKKEVSVDEGVTENDETIKTQTYLLHLRPRPHLRPSATDLLSLTLHHSRRRGRSPSLLLLTIKPN